ncbi:MAG: hypothetical protein U0263_24495 [Polyangiaceae bacterium]
MQGISRLVSGSSGGAAPARWGVQPSSLLVLTCLGLLAVGCGKEEDTRTLEPLQLGMTKGMASIYDQGETTIYEVKRPVAFPIVAPTAAEQASLNGAPVAPYPAKPWLLNSDLKVQVSWTLTNLDPETHGVELLIDPWNEFGRYWAGMSVTDAQREEQMPNLSGIDILMELPGTASGRPSRRHGTFTTEDMKELAIDLGTAMNIILTAPPPDPTLEAEDNPAVGLVNHAFAVENRSYKDVVIQQYIPGTIPGLTGFDLGLRTYEEANVAVEILVEVVDTGNEKVAKRDDDVALLPEPTAFITIANGP